MKQTNLSLDDLIVAIDAHSHPRCLYINEVGDVYKNGSPDEKKTACQKLIALLDDSDSSARFIAFMWLSSVSTNDTVIRERISRFRKDSQNKEIVARADEHLRSVLN
ncbi:MAG: hypothetical protein HZA35_00835 [Parcubacteria group bacterium]|nr:hypothetical protein [Parcubacteria group bacterium]